MRVEELTLPHPHLSSGPMGERTMLSPLTHYHLWQVRELAPSVTRVEEPALTLTCCSTQESGPCIPSEQHTRADSVAGGTGEPVLKA